MASNRKRSNSSIGNKINRIDSKVARTEKSTQAPHLDSEGIVGEHLGSESVSERALAARAVTEDKIARGAIGTDHLGVVNEITADSNLALNAGPGRVILYGESYQTTVPASGTYTLAINSDGEVVVAPVAPGEGSPGTEPTGRKPKAPTGLAASSSGLWSYEGGATSVLHINWDEVTTGTDNDPITVIHYEVYARDAFESDNQYKLIVAAIGTSTVVSPIAPGQDLFLRVRAAGASGVWSSFSTPVPVTTVGPTNLMATPSDPIVTADPGIVTVSWDGLLGGTTPPAEFRKVVVGMATSENGTYAPVGTALTGPGSVVVGGLPEAAPRWFRLQAFNSQGVPSTPSTAVRIVTIASASDETIADLVEQMEAQAVLIESVRVSANGKNKVYHQPETPPGNAYSVGDTWFDTNDGSKMYTWDGAAWQAVTFGPAAIDQTIMDAIADAQSDAAGAVTSANGKNRTWFQPTKPPMIGNVVGDTWFDTDDGNKIYGWTGSDWVPQVLDLTALAPSIGADLGSAKTRLNDAETALITLQGTLDTVDGDLADLNAELGGAVTSTSEEYTLSTSSTVPPSAGASWSTTVPAKESGKFIWRRTKSVRISGNVSYSVPVLASGTDGENAVLLRISSSRGTSFKNNNISTVLSATVFIGSKQIVNLAGLHEEFGPGAFLEWWWRRIDDSDFGVISSADTRISQGGFALTVSPADVDEQTVFQCVLQQ